MEAEGAGVTPPAGLGTRCEAELCQAAVRELGLDGAAIAVGGQQGTRQLVYATDSTSALLEDLQYTLGEGPCIDSYRTRRPVLMPNLEAAVAFARWPGFAHEATQVGARAVFAFPLQVSMVPFGVLEFYGRQRRFLGGGDLAAALLFTDDMVRVVLDDLVGALALASVPGRSVPVFGRSEVARASGMIAEQTDSSVPDALVRLRARAFAVNRPVVDLCADVVAGRYTFGDDEPVW